MLVAFRLSSFCGPGLKVFWMKNRNIKVSEVLGTNMTLTLYCYEKCGTCRKAKKFLNSRGVPFVEIPIRDQPPNKAELKKMIFKLTINRLFNTAGKTYREMNLKEKRKDMSVKELIDLLSKNGNLIKRPFAIGKAHGKEVLLTGFKEEEWKKLFP